VHGTPGTICEKFYVHLQPVESLNDGMMATPIKDTPVLFGEDARTFRKNLRETVKPWTSYTDSEKKSIREENERIRRNYDLMVRISNGAFR
jgi:hypothetical protein